MAINQAYLFLIFTLNGIFIGLLFDFFRILRKSFKTANFVTYIEDILFWIISGLSIIFLMYNFSNGDLRIFMFLGLAVGGIIYLLSISKFVIRFFVCIIGFIKRFFKVIFDIIFIPFIKIKKIYKKMNLCKKISNS